MSVHMLHQELAKVVNGASKVKVYWASSRDPIGEVIGAKRVEPDGLAAEEFVISIDENSRPKEMPSRLSCQLIDADELPALVAIMTDLGLWFLVEPRDDNTYCLSLTNENHGRWDSLRHESAKYIKGQKYNEDLTGRLITSLASMLLTIPSPPMDRSTPEGHTYDAALAVFKEAKANW